MGDWAKVAVLSTGLVFLLACAALAVIDNAQEDGWSAAADPTACDQYQPKRQKVWHAKP